MKNLRKFDELSEDAHEQAESPMYEALEEAFMQVLMKGMRIDPEQVKSLDSYNKYIILNMRSGDKLRIDFDVKHVA